MALYDPVDGVYRKVAKKYDPVDGVYRNVTKAYDPVDGVYRQYFSGGAPVGTLAVGDSVWMDVNGVSTEFLVVHQGNPDSALYDASCDGTWLLMKGIYESKVWDSSDNDYENSDIHAYLNGTFLGLFDSRIQSAIKMAKIPYWNGTGNNGSASSGSSGLSAKIFQLSCYEVGWTILYGVTLPVDGACLDYFAGCSITDPKRIAYYSSEVEGQWWLRSAQRYSDKDVRVVAADGGSGYYYSTIAIGVRPAFILDSNTTIDQSTGINIIA